MKRRIWVITLFPDFFKPFMEFGVAAQALSGKRGDGFELNLVDIGKFSGKNFKGVDDSPFGGGPGMVMRADVLKTALFEGVITPGNYGEDFRESIHTIFTSPRGEIWNDSSCRKFAATFLHNDSKKDLVFICGRYEGIDERFIENYVDQQISVGDYVLTGGELAVLTIIDSSLRFASGVLGNKESAENDSFNSHLLEQPQYTRPSEFDGVKVPDVLLSGNHGKIEKFRKEERIRITKLHRPDLYKKHIEEKDK